MRRREFLEARLRASALEYADIAQHGAAPARVFDARGDLPVIARKITEELLRELHGPQRARDEAVHRDLVELHLQPDLAREDQQLARDIGARQVVSRIRFREADAVRFLHQRAERRRPVERVEEIAERAGQNALDLQDLVAARDEIAQRRHDRKAGADVGLVEEVFLPAVHPLDQRRVLLPRERVRALVGRDDVQVRVDEHRIRIDHGRIRRAVHEGRVRQLELGNRVGKGLGPHLPS